MHTVFFVFLSLSQFVCLSIYLSVCLVVRASVLSVFGNCKLNVNPDCIQGTVLIFGVPVPLAKHFQMIQCYSDLISVLSVLF